MCKDIHYLTIPSAPCKPTTTACQLYIQLNVTIWKRTWTFSSVHQFNGITRILGMAASAAGAPDKISDDCTHRAGMDLASAEWMWVRADMIFGPSEGLTWVYGMPRDLSCCSTLVYATRALWRVELVDKDTLVLALY